MRALDPVRVAGVESFNACEVGENSTVRPVDGFIYFEVVTIAVNQCNLARKGKCVGLQRIDVVRKRIPFARILEVLVIVEIWIGLPDDHDSFCPDARSVSETFTKPFEIGRLARNFFRSLPRDLRIRTRFTIDSRVRIHPIPPSQENLIAGAKLYRQMCSRCHGTTGESDHTYGQCFYPPAPQLPLTRTLYTDNEMFWIVKHGHPKHRDASVG